MAWSTDPESANNDTTAPAAANNNTSGSGNTQQQSPQQPAQSSTPAQLLVCHNAKCTCDQAVDASPKPLKVLSHNKYFINDNGESKLIATTKENALPNLNFGKCKVPNPNNPSPCTAKLQWKDYYDHVELPGGAYVLTEKSTAVCTAKGGNIKIVQHGQQANITTEEVEKANAGGWAVNGPLVTEELIYTEEQYNNTDADGASVKSIEPVQYGSSQPVNTPVEFKANFNGNPTDAQKQGVNWIIYDTNGQPMQLRTDVGERLKVTFNKPGTYLIEAYGKTAGDKKVTTAYTVKGNELGEVKAVNNATKVRVQEPVQFTISSLFDNLPLPGNTSNITWTVTKNSGPGTPNLLNSTGPSTQVVCDDEATYVVTANLNGVAKQSKVIEALKNGITSVSASKSSGRVNDAISFTVEDHFKISPASEQEKAAVKWQCVDAQGKQVADFSSKVGETVDYKFDKPGEYTIQPYMVKPSSKVAVKITIAQPALLKAQWEYPEGGRKNKTGWNEPNHPLLVFQSAEGLMIDLEFGFINKDGKATPISTLKGIKIPDNQTPDLKGHDFIPDRNKLKNAVKEGDLFYFKVISQNKEYEIDNANIPQPQDKLKLITGEQIISIEFLKDGKPVINALYGDQMQCRIRTRNLSAEKLNVQIYRQEARMGVDALRADTLVLNGSYPIGPGGVVLFDFTLNKAWEKTYSEKLHHFYAKISEAEFFGTSTTLVAFKNDVPANGGSKVMAGVEKVNGSAAPGKCACRDQNLAWGHKIGCNERKKVIEVAGNLGVDPSWLMTVMALETARTFSPSIDNGIGYVGLVQFGKAAAETVGTTQDKLVKMTFVEQMDYVQKLLIGKKAKYKTLTDLYLAILYPSACGHGSEKDYVVLEGKAYKNNPAFFKEDDEYIEKVKKGKTIKVRGPKEGGKTYVWEVALTVQGVLTEGYGERETTFSCGVTKSPETDNNKDGVLEQMKKFVDKHVPYSQAGIRNANSEAGLAKVDCSETVALYLYKLGVMPTFQGISTGVMTTESNFRKAIGSDNIDFVAGSKDKDFKPQRGDVFVWRSGGQGHTGIVYEYDASKDVVTILEAIGSSGAVSESDQVKNGGYSGKGVSRTAKYTRTKGALYGHDGWCGYFRPKNYTKKL